MHINKVGLLYHPLVDTTRLKTQEISNFLHAQGINAWSRSAWETEIPGEVLSNTDLILTAGGDGTILRAAQLAQRNQIPVTGINMGTLGFLTELKADEVLTQLPALLSGQGWLDERTMLEARLLPVNPEGGPQALFLALNDVVLARGAVAKLIQLKASIDDRPLTVYRADGLILATATGSTGYSLAAGGPILYPQSNDILLVPVASHLSLDYRMVLPSTSTVKLQVISSGEATLSIDGHINIAVSNGATIEIKRSAKKTRFLRLHPQNDFFQVLEEKLRGKK